jgi:D-alanyl-D-alanine carboxypeptidase
MGAQNRRWRQVARATALTLSLIVGVVATAKAQVGSYRYASIVIEARTGGILSAVNADEPRHPASLTKMMTLYMTFEALRDRRITLTQLVPVSANAAAMSPTKLGLTPGTKITVVQAILGLVTKSANDAAAALGEMLGGDEERFAQIMTLRARALGMTRTTFKNASGLPDQQQITTARDMATLGRRLQVDFPNYYGYFSTPTFTFRGRAIRNHDRLLETYPGTDGLKTGYTRDSGFNLVTSSVRGGVRLVGVVLGGSSGWERDQHMMVLLDQGFEKMEVPVARRDNGPRIPSLIASAQAAPTPVPFNRASPPVVGQGSVTAAQPRAVRYGVQVGTYPTPKDASTAAQGARRVADGGDVRVEPVRVKGKLTYRAQLVGLTATEAQSTCNTLSRKRTPCMVLRPEPRQVASR